jgi:hypothetical protein
MGSKVRWRSRRKTDDADEISSSYVARSRKWLWDFFYILLLDSVTVHKTDHAALRACVWLDLTWHLFFNQDGDVLLFTNRLRTNTTRPFALKKKNYAKLDSNIFFSSSSFSKGLLSLKLVLQKTEENKRCRKTLLLHIHFCLFFGTWFFQRSYGTCIKWSKVSMRSKVRDLHGLF